MTERDMVRGCREGNREAQQELYDRTCERIYRLLLRMTASPDDAFDLVQETYLRAFTRIDRFDGRSAVSTWLYRVAVNEALQFLRRAGRSRENVPQVAPESHVESDLERSEVKIDVNDALAELAPSDRAILLLRYQEGLDYRAMSEILECAAGTVASRLNRARNALRGILQKGYALEEDADHGEHPNDVERNTSEPGRDRRRLRTGS